MATTLAKSLRADTVSRLRLREPFGIAPSTPVGEAVRGMTQRRTGCALILDTTGKLVGIFTERDFLNRVIAQGLESSGPVERVMTPAPKAVKRHESVLSVIEAMSSGGYRHVPVVGDHGEPVGVLSVKDVVHYLAEYFPAKVYNLPPTPDQQAQPAREGA